MTFPISGRAKLIENLPGNYINVNEAIEANELLAHGTFELDVGAGGTITVTADDNLKAGVYKLTGSPVGAFTVAFPDGDRDRTIHNGSGQTATIDTVTGSLIKPTVVDAAAKRFSFDGVELRLEQAWTVL